MFMRPPVPSSWWLSSAPPHRIWQVLATCEARSEPMWREELAPSSVWEEQLIWCGHTGQVQDCVLTS